MKDPRLGLRSGIPIHPTWCDVLIEPGRRWMQLFLVPCPEDKSFRRRRRVSTHDPERKSWIVATRVEKPRLLDVGQWQRCRVTSNDTNRENGLVEISDGRGPLVRSDDAIVGQWRRVTTDDARDQRALGKSDNLGDLRSEDPAVGEGSRIAAHHSRREGELVERGDGLRDLAWGTMNPTERKRRRITLDSSWPDDLMELVWNWCCCGSEDRTGANHRPGK